MLPDASVTDVPDYTNSDLENGRWIPGFSLTGESVSQDRLLSLTGAFRRARL